MPPPPEERIPAVFGKIFRHMADDWELSAVLSGFKSTILFLIADLPGNFYFDLGAKEPKVELIRDERPAEISIRLSYRDFHLYWCHRIDLLKAISLRKIRIEGPFNRLMQLNDLVSEARKMYIREFYGDDTR